MLITERKFYLIKTVNIYFVDTPVQESIPGYHVLTYHTYENWGDIPEYEKHTFFTTTIDLRQDLETIWGKINRQHRRHIKRSEKNGTQITLSKNYEGFYQIYKKLFQEKKYADPSGLNVLTPPFMEKYGTLFTAENQGELIGGAFYFHDGKNVLFCEGAYKNIENTPESKKLTTDAMCCLHWEAIKYFKEMGNIIFDLGDVSSDDKEINSQMNGGDVFKRSFGGEVIASYMYRKFNSRHFQSLFRTWKFLRANGEVLLTPKSAEIPPQ
jgi:hypothetical protein